MKSNPWLDRSKHGYLEDGQQVWALWTDGKIEIAVYMDWRHVDPYFQRKCNTDENCIGWNGNVGMVKMYAPLSSQPPPHPDNWDKDHE